MVASHAANRVPASFGGEFALKAVLRPVISLIGIVTGLVVLAGLLSGKRLDSWTAVFS